MDFLCYGDALWEPAPTYSYTCVNIGDVGFIRRGQFHLLFSAGSPLGERQLGEDVPTTFEELTVGTPVSSQPRLPGCLHTDTVREVGAGLGATVSTTPLLEPGANFSFELTGNCGAALVTKYPTYREDSPLDSAFERYTKRHYDSWVAFARHKQYGNDIQPVLVSGFDMTRDFAMVAYSHEDISLGSDFTIAIPTLAPAPASVWGTWRTRCSPHTNYGPQMCNPLAPEQAADIPSQSVGERRIPNEFSQCVFVRYYTMRSRKPMGLFHKVIRAGAGPYDLGSGENRGDSFPESTAQSDSESTTVIEEDLGRWWSPITDDTDSESDVVVRNTPYDGEYDSWNAIAHYIFQNSNAVSALMHHRDLEGIRTAGEKDSMPTLLAKHKPSITVDANGVGRIAREGDQQPPASRSDDPESHSPTDDLLSKHPEGPPALIAVMGARWSGKTTFVNQASESNLKSVEDISEIRKSEEFILDGRRVVLLDTPGFDYIDTTDLEVMASLTGFLNKSYPAGTQLAGIIYVHDICDHRYRGFSARSLRTLRELCGTETLMGVTIATNMWGRITPELGEAREQELKENFLKAAIEQGAQLCRYYDNPESARAILREILKNLPVVDLEVQPEPNDENRAAGQAEAAEPKQEIRNAERGRQKEARELENMRWAKAEENEES